jgi:zinc protease
MKFYTEHASASNAVLGVVGPVEAAEITSLFEEFFDDWRSEEVCKPFVVDYHDVSAKRIPPIETPGKSNAIYLAQQPLNYGELQKDEAALYLAIEALDSRLWKLMRGEKESADGKKEGLSYGIRTRLKLPALSTGSTSSEIIIEGSLAPQNLARFETMLMAELTNVLEHGFSSEELDIARNAYLASRRSALTNETALANLLAYLRQHNLDFHERQREEESYRKITTEEMHDALKKYLRPEKLTVVAAGDFKGAQKQ